MHCAVPVAGQEHVVLLVGGEPREEEPQCGHSLICEDLVTDDLVVRTGGVASGSWQFHIQHVGVLIPGVFIKREAGSSGLEDEGAILVEARKQGRASRGAREPD